MSLQLVESFSEFKEFKNTQKQSFVNQEYVTQIARAQRVTRSCEMHITQHQWAINNSHQNDRSFCANPL